MNKPNLKLLAAAVATGIAVTAFAEDVAKTNPLSSRVRGHEGTEWSQWSNGGMYNRNDNRVLLIGDSITCQYRGEAFKALFANFRFRAQGYWASSYCASMPSYQTQLKLLMDETRYDVIHFNNGLHSLGTDLEAYEKGMRDAILCMKAAQPQAKIIWVSSTPVRDLKLNEKVKAVNKVGAKVAAEFALEVDDLYSIIEAHRAEDPWSDGIHLNAPYVKMLAESVTKICLTWFDGIGGKVPEVAWKLKWSDEFDGPELNTAIWSRIPTPSVDGKKSDPINGDWNRHMSERADLVTFDKGVVSLWGKANDGADKNLHPWLTGGIWTRNHKDRYVLPKHGKVVIRAKFAHQKGAWPALWLMPVNEKVDAYGANHEGGEIDITEKLNSDPYVYQTTHNRRTVRQNLLEPLKSRVAAFKANQFNEYGLEFDANQIIWSVNGVVTHVYNRMENDDGSQWPYDHDFFLILDQQLGGEWVGDVDLKTLPVKMELDWVRVYERP